MTTPGSWADSPHNVGQRASYFQVIHKAAYDRAFTCLGERGPWENRQRNYYQMRHDGLRRINKPWPSAADLHFPLIDMTVGDLKPFWMAQAFSGDRIADFVCLQADQDDGMTEAAADFLDFDLRYQTNFRYVMERAVDTMLVRGRGVLQILHDPRKNRILFKSIDPLFIIMDGAFDDFDDATEFTHVQHLTLDQYKAIEQFDQKPDTIAAIHCAQGEQWDFRGILTEKEVREGWTHSSKGNRVVLWNHYKRLGSEWVLTTYCPAALDKEIRKPFKLTTSWEGEPLLNFYSMTMEIKDEGWYAPRGLAELNAAFENYASKLWCEKADAMTFGNRPLFTGDGDLGNSGNVRFLPGEYIPGNIQAVQMAQPSFSFAEEISFTKNLAERRSRTPDFSQFSPEDTGGKPITATQSRIAAGLQSVGADHNGDTFRSVRLQKILKHTWALKVQFQPQKLVYYASQSVQALPEQALHSAYLVIPAGGSGTKQEKLQRATSRYTLLKGDPDIDQLELKRGLISADDARLVKKLLIGQSARQQSEYVDQVIKINAGLADGFPVPPMPGEDQAVRIKACVDWLEKQQHVGAHPDPIAIHSVEQHIQARLLMLKQINPKQAQEVIQQIAQTVQRSQPPPNSVPMPQQQGQEQQQPQPAVG